MDPGVGNAKTTNKKSWAVNLFIFQNLSLSELTQRKCYGFEMSEQLLGINGLFIVSLCVI